VAHSSIAIWLRCFSVRCSPVTASIAIVTGLRSAGPAASLDADFVRPDP
jgi:hypothetical protein